MDVISSVANWPFLQEPLYRWAIFGGATVAFLIVLHGLQSYMKE